jgi:hypothetical protein
LLGGVDLFTSRWSLPGAGHHAPRGSECDVHLRSKMAADQSISPGPEHRETLAEHGRLSAMVSQPAVFILEAVHFD